MKTIIEKMMKAKILLSMMVLVTMGTMLIGCSNADDPVGTIDMPGKKVILTTTISFDGATAKTRGLDAEGHKTFAVGDQIAVAYEDIAGKMQKAVTAELTADDITDGGKKATITVVLTDPKANGALRYIYPAAMACDDGSVNYAALKKQDGTLASLAATLDLALYEGALFGEELPADVMLTNPLCIGEFNIKNNSADITSTITMMTVFDGSNAYIVKREAAEGPIYVAMQPVSSDMTLQFCATDGTTNYRKSVSGKALAAGNMYPVNLTMPTDSRTCLELLTDNYTAQNGDTLTGVLLEGYKIIAKKKVTLDGVDINTTYPVSFNGAGIGCSTSTTLILADGSDNKVTAGAAGFAGIYISSSDSRTLTIRGNGSLTAMGKTSGAGIGVLGLKNNVNIVIESGTITAIGGKDAAGIGTGGAYNKRTIYCGDITISGGNITAIGGVGAAGIGTGRAVGSRIACRSILISGGSVTATGGSLAAGIGTGMYVGPTDYGHNYYYRIVITNTVTLVTAEKGHDGVKSIGRGVGGQNQISMDMVYIGCALDDKGKPVGNPTGEVKTSPYTYIP